MNERHREYWAAAAFAGFALLGLLLFLIVGSIARRDRLRDVDFPDFRGSHLLRLGPHRPIRSGAVVGGAAGDRTGGAADGRSLVSGHWGYWPNSTEGQ